MKQFIKQRLVIGLLLALFCFLTLVALFISSEQRDVMRRNSLRDIQADLDLISTATTEALLKSDYVAVRNFVRKWGSSRAEVHELRITAPNGFVIAEYTNAEPVVGEIYSLSKVITFGPAKLAAISLRGDHCEAEQAMLRLRNRLILAAAILTALLGSAVWLLFRNMAIEPLEDAVNRRTQELLQTNRELKQLTDNSPTCIMLFDRQGRCLRWNKPGLAMMQLPPSEVQGKPFRDLWPEEIRPRADEVVQQVLAGSACSFDACRWSGLRKAWWSVMLAPVADNTGTIATFIAIAMDITDRKQAEEERIAFCEERLTTAHLHNREKEQLLMDLHDGIGGLAVNISMLASLGQQARDAADMQKTLESIFQLAQEGIGEVRSFMTSLDPQELTWRSLATELKCQGGKMLEPHGIAYTFTPSIGDVDRKPSSLVWVNLIKIHKEAITNAIKHSQADEVSVDFTVNDKGLQLAIRDNGVGRANHHAVGRGLPNIRKRARLIGGQVTLSNTGGMLISLTVPLPVRLSIPA